MAFSVITGRYFVVNYSPDGDTIRFKPDNPADLARLEGVPAKLNGRGHCSLRLEAIDALETHFENRHQPLQLANQARDELLQFLGIANVVWDTHQSSVISANDAAQGYIIARATEKFGRVVAFAFPGPAPQPTGTDIFLTPAMLNDSANAHMINVGLAYPTYYQTLFADLRAHLTNLVTAARGATIGIYGVDRTNALFAVPNIGALTDGVVIMPKLFRRASTYVAAAGTINGFKAALATNQEPVLDLRDNNFTHFDTFVDEQAGQIQLTRRPEELVFDPMPERPGGEFSTMMNNGA
jgi:hypothetical protein